MTDAAPSTPLFESTLRALEQHPHQGPSWLSSRQSEAATELRARGLPHNRQEAWRFTSLRALSRLTPRPSVPQPAFDPPMPTLGGVTAHVLTVGGHVVMARAPETPGVVVLPLSRALADAPDVVEPHLMRLSRQTGGGFSAHNDALFDDAVVVVLDRGAALSEPLVVWHETRSGAEAMVSHPRVLVVAGEQSRARVVEIFRHESPDESAGGRAPHLVSSVTELVLGPGANLEHVRLGLGSAGAFTVSAIEVEQARDSTLSSRTFTLGGALSRVDLTVRLAGEGASCQLDGLYLADAAEQVDHHTVVEHRVGHATSNQRYKGIALGDGNAVFDGTVLVRPGADGTTAHQKNQNLLLSDTATVHTKPHLEIDTDDVVCSHGATVGRLDDTQMFYLRSRGIDEEAARAILVDAFMNELVDSVEDDSLREAVRRAVREATPFGHLAEALS
jgi:Fe-S cluster assembly protein SufD